MLLSYVLSQPWTDLVQNNDITPALRQMPAQNNNYFQLCDQKYSELRHSTHSTTDIRQPAVLRTASCPELLWSQPNIHRVPTTQRPVVNLQLGSSCLECASNGLWLPNWRFGHRNDYRFSYTLSKAGETHSQTNPAYTSTSIHTEQT